MPLIPISYSSVSCCRRCLRCANDSSPSLFTLNLKSAFSRGFSFRKLQILISQTTDLHFANYRFPFRFVPFRFVSFRFAPFRFANYSKPLKSLLPHCWVCIEKGLHRNFYSLHSKPLTLLLTLSCRKTLTT